MRLGPHVVRRGGMRVAVRPSACSPFPGSQAANLQSGSLSVALVTLPAPPEGGGHALAGPSSSIIPGQGQLDPASVNRGHVIVVDAVGNTTRICLSHAVR